MTTPPDSIDTLGAKVTAIITTAVPSDMDASRVIERSNLLFQLIGRSRTSTLGAILYGAICAANVGIDKATIVKLVEDITDLLATSPDVQASAKAYTDAVEQAQTTQVSPVSVLPPAKDIH